MDRFDAMQAFARVVETGSFTKAAETLRISRTSVTQLVQQLEARLRVRLLNRTTRQVNVTADGAAYYERVLRLLADMDDAETSLSDASASPRPAARGRAQSLRAHGAGAGLAGLPCAPSRDPAGPGRERPQGGPHRRERGLRDPRRRAAGPIAARARVADLRLGVYASPGYLAMAGVPRHPGELEDSHHRIVGYLWARLGRALPYAMQRGDERLRVHGRYALAVDDGNAYLQAGLAGLGILWLPDYMARPHLASGELARLFEDWDMETMPMYLAYPPNRHVSAKLRAFIDWVVELMERQA